MIIPRRSRLSAFLINSLLFFAVLVSSSFAGQFAGEEKISDRSVIDRLSRGENQDLIIIYDNAEASAEASVLRRQAGVSHDTREIVRHKSSIYRAEKSDVHSDIVSSDAETLRDYESIPASFVRVRSVTGLHKLAAHAKVIGIYKNRKMSHMLTESLPLIGQPAASAAGYNGSGTSVAIIDGRIDYTNGAFGCSIKPPDCLSGLISSEPGCRIACIHDYVSASFDDHGTNVAGIVAGVAPQSKIIALTVFDATGAWDSDILAAVDWATANQSAYDIAAINMSLGDSTYHSVQCPNDSYTKPVADARSAGILSIIAAGNDTYTNGLSSPACVPGAVSAGAVYDADMGPINWGDCYDAFTAPDSVVCFSNNASYMTVFAPGCDITAAGIPMCGTSMATPHVAGAVAVLRSGFPSDTVDATVNRMVSTGMPVTDSRNHLSPITKPRIDIAAAVAVSNFISGRVTKPSGAPLDGITITLSGVVSDTTLSDINGYYSFGGLDAGSYTVTPSSPLYSFTPADKTVSAPASGVDFTAKIYSLSGFVKTSKGTAVQGVAVSVSGGPSSGSAITDASGAYRISDLIGGIYTVTPSKSGTVFSPSSSSVNLASNVTGVNFTVTTYKISGFVYSSGITPMSGVTVKLTGAASKSFITGSDGSYLFDDLASGNYTVTPSKAGYSFTPIKRDIAVSGSDQSGINFTRAYSISGRIKPKKGSMSYPNIMVSLSGLSAAETVTDSSGYYIFGGLMPGNYTVTPSKGNFVFSPLYRTVSVNNADIGNSDFKLSAYTLSGTVKTTTGSGVLGVTVSVSGCDIKTSVLTAKKGKFKITNLPNCTYTVTPTLMGRAFSPNSMSVTVDNANLSGISFVTP